MTDFVDKAEKELTTIVEDSQKVVANHLMLCDFYGVDAKDEMREKSETFFKVFQEFFKLCEKALPPEPKKVKGKAPAAGARPGPNAAMMAELMKKQSLKGPVEETAH